MATPYTRLSVCRCSTGPGIQYGIPQALDSITSASMIGFDSSVQLIPVSPSLRFRSCAPYKSARRVWSLVVEYGTTMGCSMSDLFLSFTALPAYGLAAVVVLLLYAVQSEVRFGQKARTIFPGSADRGSTLAVLLSSAIPVLGFVLAMKRTPLGSGGAASCSHIRSC